MNASYGIWNRGASNKTVYLWADYPFFPNNIVNFYVNILDDTGAFITWWTTSDWSNIGEANAVSWTATAGMKYTLYIILMGASFPSDPSEEIALALKTDP